MVSCKIIRLADWVSQTTRKPSVPPWVVLEVVDGYALSLGNGRSVRAMTIG